jgi:hypothetical protein
MRVKQPLPKERETMNNDTTNNDTTGNGESGSGSDDGMSLLARAAIGAINGYGTYRAGRYMLSIPHRVQLARRRKESERRVEAIRNHPLGYRL